jgi:hypothetical protein
MSRHFGSVMVPFSVGFMRASIAWPWAGFALAMLEKKRALYVPCVPQKLP